MEFCTESQPLSQRRPLGSFSGTSVAPCGSGGSQIFSLESSNSPNARVSFQQPVPDVEVDDQGAPRGACRFRRLLVDDCSRSRLFAMALEHFFLQRNPADSSPVYCIICQEYFGNVRDMLRHLRDCSEFGKGEYWCPTCNTKEHFRTSSKKKCSWLRTRLGNKIKKGLEEALKLLPGSKQTLCSNCRGKIEVAEWSFGHYTEKPSWASLGEEGLTASDFLTSSTRSSQQYNKPHPAQNYAMPRSLPPSELYDTSRRSELSNMDVYSYAADRPQAPRFNFPQGIPEIDSSAVGPRAFPELAGEQTFPISSKPPYASAETSPLASYDTSPTEVSSVAPSHMSHTVFNVSPASSTDSRSGGPCRRAHPSPDKAFGTDLDSFAPEGLSGCIAFSHGQPAGSGTTRAAFTTHPTASTDSLLGTPWGAAAAAMGTSQSLTIDTTLMNMSAFSPTWGPQHSYVTIPTTTSFRNSPMRSVTSPSHGVTKPSTVANENRSPMSAHSSSLMSPSLSLPSPSSSSSSTASPTSDASGPVSTDGAAGAGPLLQCPECGFRPSGKNVPAYMRKHRLKHAPRRRVKCNYCPATFTRLDNCKNHARTAHHGGRKRAGSSGVLPPDPRRRKTRGSEAGEP